MSLSSSFVSTGDNLTVRCILCNEAFPVETEKRNEDTTKSGRCTLEKYANQWQVLDTRVCDAFPFNEFRNVSCRLNMSSEQEKFVVHYSCSVNFRTKINRKQSQQSSLPPITQDDLREPQEDMLISPSSSRTRRLCAKPIERILYVMKQVMPHCHTMMVALVDARKIHLRKN